MYDIRVSPECLHDIFFVCVRKEKERAARDGLWGSGFFLRRFSSCIIMQWSGGVIRIGFVHHKQRATGIAGSTTHFFVPQAQRPAGCVSYPNAVDKCTVAWVEGNLWLVVWEGGRECGEDVLELAASVIR